MKSPRRLEIDQVLLLLISASLVWGVFLLPEQLQLRSEEPRRALVAMEMIFSGDYWAPTLHDWTYFNKPPLFNWVLVGCMQLFDSFDEWVVRLPGQVSFVLTGCLLFFFSRRWLPREQGLWAALLFLTSAEILFYGIIISGQIDLFFTLITFLHIGTLVRAVTEEKGSSFYLLSSYLLLGVGTLTKGTPALAFHGLTMIAIMWHGRSLRFLWRWEHWIGGAVFVAWVGAYFYQHDRGFIYLINLIKEASQKSGLEGNVFDVLGNAISFPFILLKAALPGSLLVFMLSDRVTLTKVWEDRRIRLLIMILGLNVLPYMFASTLRMRYLYPFLPWLAIIFAYLAYVSAGRRTMKFFYYFMVSLMLLAPIGFLLLRILPLEIFIGDFWIKFFLLGIICMGLFMGWRKYPQKRMHFSLLFVLVAKIYANWIYYPTRHADEQINALKVHAHEFFQITEGAPIMLFGHPQIEDREVGIGPFEFGSVSFEVPMPLSITLPYYIEKRQGQTMEFHTEMKPDVYYLARMADIDSLAVEVLYSFEDDWERRPLALCRLE